MWQGPSAAHFGGSLLSTRTPFVETGVSKKRLHDTLVHNFAKCWPIFTISSAADLLAVHTCRQMSAINVGDKYFCRSPVDQNALLVLGWAWLTYITLQWLVDYWGMLAYNSARCLSPTFLRVGDRMSETFVGKFEQAVSREFINKVITEDSPHTSNVSPQYRMKL